MRASVKVKGMLLLMLLCITCCIWYAAVREDRSGQLTLSILAVGQGNAIFVDAPSGRQVLIDGGPDGSVLRALGSVMPPWNRSLDVVLATDAAAGDASGLVDVLQRYSVGTILQTGVENTSAPWNLFEQEAAASGKKIFTARRGQIIDLGAGAYIEILFPDRSSPGAADAEGCVVARIVYGSTSFLFACDATAGGQKYLTMLDGTKLGSDVLISGVGQTLSPTFVGYIAPTYTVAPCNTKSSSSPDPIFQKLNIQMLTTCSGTVTFASDGKLVSRK